jgi:DNA-binding response OmpR family regulator
VRVVLRRVPDEVLEGGPVETKLGDLTVQFLRHEVFHAGHPLELTPVEFRLLGMLVRAPGRIFTRAHLVGRVLGYEFDGLDRNIDVHISNLRRKLGRAPSHHQHIRTVYGAGYRFCGADEEA